uniref:Sulfotransferase n=1 Tax=Tetraselmis sp. GSL018 TaxID=582737 RepID=A0A061QHZ3_9CHLO
MLDCSREGLCKITFEASIWYYTNFQVLKTLARVLPCVRLIWLLRNPLARARSAYYHYVTVKTAGARQTGNAKLRSFEQVLVDEIAALENCQRQNRSSVTTGFRSALLDCYFRQVSRFQPPFNHLIHGLYNQYVRGWLRYFPVEQMHFINYNRLKEKPMTVVARLLSFLGLANSTVPQAGIKEQQRKDRSYSDTERMHSHLGQLSNETRARVAEVVAPHVRDLYALIGSDLGWNLSSER